MLRSGHIESSLYRTFTKTYDFTCGKTLSPIKQGALRRLWLLLAAPESVLHLEYRNSHCTLSARLDDANASKRVLVGACHNTPG